MNFWFLTRRASGDNRADAVRAALAPLGMTLEKIMDTGGIKTVVVQVDSTVDSASQAEVTARLRTIPTMDQARVIFTAERAPAAPLPAPEHGPAFQISGRRPPQVIDGLATGVNHIIAVASGKGGVGKSTVAVHLAVALARAGIKTGLLDADIYGPSVPTMMGIADQKPVLNDKKKLVPIAAHGVACMSIGMLVDQGVPMIWRGPMVQSAIVQLLRDVDWAGIEVLVIDLPPGTGDAQLTMAQKIKLTGAIIVSTPQDVALLDAQKGLAMFQKTGVPILGIVENMSVFCCPQCGHASPIFGANGARDLAAREGVPFLGAIPLDITLRQQADTGVPAPTPIFDQIAADVLQALNPNVIDKAK
jgi:ATP-binding protein involved in chromosome partitioning